MKKQIITALAIVATVGCVQAEVINIAFHNGTATVGRFDTFSDGTVVSAGSNGSDTWNNVVNSGGDGTVFSGKALLLSDGTSSGGATLDVNSGATWYNDYWDASSDDGIMMDGWYGFNASESVTVSGLSSAFTSGEGYKVTIYTDSNQKDRIMSFTLGGTTKSVTDPGAFTGTFIEDVNYVTFTGLSADNFQVFGGGSARAAITGMIVETIPEPATLGMVAFFGAGLLMIRRKFTI